MLCVFCCHAPARQLQGLPKITMKALSPAPHNRSRPAIARPVSPGLQAPQRPALVPAPGGRARWRCPGGVRGTGGSPEIRFESALTRDRTWLVHPPLLADAHCLGRLEFALTNAMGGVCQKNPV